MGTWAERMKSRIKELELTQLEVADKLGITRSSICHYLANRRVPALEQFEKIAAILQCDPAWLQYGTSKNVSITEDKTVTRKKGGGEKLNRTIIIQARLDPKLHKAAEIMARNQRRTLSNFVEILIEAEAKKYDLEISTEVKIENEVE